MWRGSAPRTEGEPLPLSKPFFCLHLSFETVGTTRHLLTSIEAQNRIQLQHFSISLERRPSAGTQRHHNSCFHSLEIPASLNSLICKVQTQ